MKKRDWLLLAAAGLALAFFLAWVSSGWKNVFGWPGFTLALAINAVIFWVGFHLLKKDGLPGWVAWLSVGAALLRLVMGVIWFLALPQVGYDTPMQQAGYVMEDAFRRDSVAWELAQSGDPLMTAFTGYRAVDQYGGLLFLSAVVYRFLGGPAHTPLLMVVFTAAAAGLSVAFAWSFSRWLFDQQVAKWAALGMALYPEAVFLGSTQMREPFLMLLVSAAAYGFVKFMTQNEARSWHSLLWTAGGLLLMVPLSITMAGILVGLLAVIGLSMLPSRPFASLQITRRRWVVLGGGTLVVLVAVSILLSIFWDRLPLDTLVTWVKYVAQWQATLTFQASGWIQKILRSTPDWFHMPFLLGYGVTRPLLPAALMARSAGPGGAIWKIIAIWRSLGWILVLAAVAYASLRAMRLPDKRRMLLGLCVAVWLTILFTSFWGGADDWDNPRYRAAFSLFQLALAAWAVVEQRRSPDPWFRRMIVMAGLFMFWIGLWYVQRYVTAFPWLVNDLFKTLGLGAVSSVLYLVWDWVKAQGKSDM